MAQLRTSRSSALAAITDLCLHAFPFCVAYQVVVETMLFELLCDAQLDLVHYSLVALTWLTNRRSGAMRIGKGDDNCEESHSTTGEMDIASAEVSARRRAVGEMGAVRRLLQLVESGLSEPGSEGTAAEHGSRILDRTSVSGLLPLSAETGGDAALQSHFEVGRGPLPCDETGSVPVPIRSWAVKLLMQLAAEPLNQARIAECGLQVLIHAQRRRIGTAMDHHRLEILLQRLREHPDNRTRFYKCELRLKKYDVHQGNTQIAWQRRGELSVEFQHLTEEGDAAPDEVTEFPSQTYTRSQPWYDKEARLFNSMQNHISDTWASGGSGGGGSLADEDFASATQCSPFLVPSEPRELNQIMQEPVPLSEPLVPNSVSLPQCLRQRPTVAPRPVAATLPMASPGHYGLFPDQPLSINLEIVALPPKSAASSST